MNRYSARNRFDDDLESCPLSQERGCQFFRVVLCACNLAGNNTDRATNEQKKERFKIALRTRKRQCEMRLHDDKIQQNNTGKGCQFLPLNVYTSNTHQVRKKL